MRILVLGGDGFIGRRLIGALKDTGVHLVAPSRSELDIVDGAFPRTAVDVVYHLAGRTFVPDSWDKPADFFKVNAYGTTRVLEYCKQVGARLTYLSGYCYGNPERLPIDESAPLQPTNPYAFSKVAAEQSCRFFSEAYGVGVTILRPFNVYGPDQPPHFLIPELVRKALDVKSPNISIADGTPRRDYVHVTDLVRAITSAPVSAGKLAVYNVGCGRSYSVLELAELVSRISGSRKPVVSRNEARRMEIADCVADVSAIRRDAGWVPLVPLEDGLLEMIDAERAVQARSSSDRAASL